MRWIKYQIVQTTNGEEPILINKKVGYSNENLVIAQSEAYDGYEIIEDEMVFEKEPLDMHNARIKNVGYAKEDGDAIPKKQAETLFAPSGYVADAIDIASESELDIALTNIIANMTDLTERHVVFQDNAGLFNGGFTLARIFTRVGTYATATFETYGYYGYTKWVKNCFSGTWYQHEWDNPPMLLGVEYRTTERWNGKAVYTALLNLGYGPNSGTFDINTNLVATQPIRATARIAGGGSNQTVPYENNSESVSISGFANAQAQLFASLRTNFNATSKVIWAQFWYIKE